MKKTFFGINPFKSEGINVLGGKFYKTFSAAIYYFGRDKLERLFIPGLF
jgi:hypothetical protein